MALICSRHSFEYAENVCSSCGIAFCHDCLVYPRGPKKPPLCVPCAISAAGVRSSARNPSNLSRREVKKRVAEAKGLQQPQPYVEAPVAANPDRDFELTSNATFDQGWAVSWDEGRDPHPGISRAGARDLGYRSVRKPRRGPLRGTRRTRTCRANTIGARTTIVRNAGRTYDSPHQSRSSRPPANRTLHRRVHPTCPASSRPNWPAATPRRARGACRRCAHPSSPPAPSPSRRRGSTVQPCRMRQATRRYPMPLTRPHRPRRRPRDGCGATRRRRTAAKCSAGSTISSAPKRARAPLSARIPARVGP